MNQSAKEAVKYAIVGVTGIIVEWITFFIFRDFIGIYFQVAQVLSMICGTTNNFFLNRKFTFKATDRVWFRAASFFGIASLGWVLGYFLIGWLVLFIQYYVVDLISFVSFSEVMIQNIAKLGTTVIIAGLQFFANKFITFKKREEV